MSRYIGQIMMQNKIREHHACQVRVCVLNSSTERNRIYEAT
ncbi:hypothetical protein ACP70R_017963 [Stipagrostis hirtigluma subsp. patula]